MKRQERETRRQEMGAKDGVKSAVRERGICGEGERVYLITQSFRLSPQIIFVVLSNIAGGGGRAGVRRFERSVLLCKSEAEVQLDIDMV